MTTALIVTVSLVLMAAVGFAAGAIKGRRHGEAHRRFLERELAQQESCITGLKRKANGTSADGSANGGTEDDSDSRVAELQERLARAEALADGHRDTVESLQREVRELREAAADPGRTGLIEAERIEGLERELERRQTQIDALEGTVHEHDAGAATLQQELATARQELASLHQQLHERDEAMAALRAGGDGPQGTAASLPDEDARRLLAAREEEIETLRQEAAGLQARMDERLRKAEHESERIKRVAEARRLELADLNRELASLPETLSTDADDAETTRSQRQQLGLQLQESRVAEETLRQALTTRQEALSRARAELTELEARYGGQIAERDARIRELEATQTDGAEAARQHRERAERLQVVVDELSTRIKEYQVAAEARDETLRGREEALEKLRQEAAEIEARYATQLRSVEHEIERLSGELTAAGDARAAATATIARARAESDELRDELEQERTARIQAEDHEKLLQVRVGDLQAQVAGRAEELVKARAANQELESNYSDQITQRDQRVVELQERLAAADSSAVTAHAAARTAAERTEQVREELEERDQTLADTLEQVASLTARLGELEERLATSQTAAAEERGSLEQSIERMRDAERQARDESASLRLELESARRAVERQALATAELEESAARQQRERESEIARLNLLLETRSDEIREAVQRAEQAEEALNQATIRVGDEQMTVGELQRQLQARETDIEVLRADVERNQLALELLEADLAERAASHERSMRERRLETERLQGLLEARTQEQQLAATRLEQVSADLTRTMERLHRRDIRIDAQEAEMGRYREKRDRLQRELHEREQQLRQLRALMRSEPQDADDLEQIHGIGPKVARLLNEAGVICFRQIARWEAGDVEWLLEHQPDLRGRIHRDAWIEEARAAHLGKYGEDLG